MRLEGNRLDRVSENNVGIRFRTNGIEKIVEELTSQGERSDG